MKTLKSKLAAIPTAVTAACMLTVPALATAAEAEESGFDMGGYILKGAILLAVGVVLYLIVTMKNKKNKSAAKKPAAKSKDAKN